MLIVISAVASAVALCGALLVGYSTKTTIAGMVPTRDPGSVLTDFPADIEAQLKEQSMVATGVAPAPVPQPETAAQQAESLRDALGRASVVQLEPRPTGADAQALVGQLQSVLLGEQTTDPEVAALRDYALRQLSAQDGSINLPDYYVDESAIEDGGMDGQVETQIAQLQHALNEQIATLPELQGREINYNEVQLSSDPQQLAAAIHALELQSEMLGLDFGGARYDTLQNLGEQLLRSNDGAQVSLDGLDMAELEAISRELLAQLDQSQDADEPQ
jgi:hypothetical protein